MFDNTIAVARFIGGAYKPLWANFAFSPLIGLYHLSKKLNCIPKQDDNPGWFFWALIGFLISAPIKIPLWLIGGPIALGLSAITFSLAVAASAIVTGVLAIAVLGTGLYDALTACCSPCRRLYDAEQARLTARTGNTAMHAAVGNPTSTPSTQASTFPTDGRGVAWERWKADQGAVPTASSAEPDRSPLAFTT